MTTDKQLTPLSLAVPPSAMEVFALRPPYDPRRQYAAEHGIVKSNPSMKATTQTFDQKGKPKDSDQD